MAPSMDKCWIVSPFPWETSSNLERPLMWMSAIPEIKLPLRYLNLDNPSRGIDRQQYLRVISPVLFPKTLIPLELFCATFVWNDTTFYLTKSVDSLHAVFSNRVSSLRAVNCGQSIAIFFSSHLFMKAYILWLTIVVTFQVMFWKHCFSDL